MKWYFIVLIVWISVGFITDMIIMLTAKDVRKAYIKTFPLHIVVWLLGILAPIFVIIIKGAALMDEDIRNNNF